MDYRRFLGKQEELVLPYLGGPTLVAPGRGLRLQGEVAPGWWRFRISGRQATPLEPADPDLEALQGLPRCRGHLLGPRLVDDRADCAPVGFLPEDEPPLFALATARRWHSGELLFEQLELETEAEEAARRALEERGSLAGVKGAPASLRAAFAFALAELVGRELGLPAAPLEVRPHTRALAEGGPEAAARVLRELERRRQEARRRPAPPRPAPAAGPSSVLLRWDAAAERADAALYAAGARLLRLRRLTGGRGARSLEVTYLFQGARFHSVVDAETLQVLDAGVCLSGEDRLLTLESLPGVIREAIDTGQLVITRRDSDDD